MDDLSDFLNFARDRLTNTDEPVPCEPEDCAAVIGYLCALVPEYELSRQEGATDLEARRADRRRAMLDGFRRARGAAAVTPLSTRRPATADDEDGEGDDTEAA